MGLNLVFIINPYAKRFKGERIPELGLTTIWFWMDTPTMSRKIIAASLVAVWLAFFGVEFLEDIDFADNFQVHKTARATLASFGEAIKIVDDIQIIALQTQSGQPVFYPSAYVSLQWFREETRLLKKDFKIYKLHRTFLI